MASSSIARSIPKEEIDGRLRETRERMASDGFAALLAYADTWRTANVRYFSDFRGIDGVHDIARMLLLIPANGDPTLFVGGGCDAYAASVTTFPVHTFASLQSVLSGWAKSAASGPVGIAGAGLIPAVLRDAVSEALGNIQINPTDLLARQKAVKSPWELLQLREAGRITDLAMETIRERLATGASFSERDLARSADAAMIEAGADGPGYLSMVQSGPRSEWSLALPSDRILQRGELVMTDIGARYGAYVADGGRGFAYGPVSDAQRDIIETAADAVDAGLEAMAPGMTAAELNEMMQGILVERGYAEYSSEAQGRGVGHGTGMDAEEELPWIGPTDETVLEPGMVFTLKTTINVPKLGGLRTERIVHLSAEGADPLDLFPMRNYW